MEPEITISTWIRSYDNPLKVVDSVRNIFPDWEPEKIPLKSDFPVSREDIQISSRVESLDKFLSIIRDSRILDTALDAMAMEADLEGTKFHISRQSAFIGKISFVLDENPIGGIIEVSLKANEIVIWLEQFTWHSGREIIPREVGDELAMTSFGGASEWFDSSGNGTH